MKIGVLGAGITGLSTARFLNSYFDVEVLEKKSVCGGIARTKSVNGSAYHMVGGHCFNSKYKEVLEFVFNEVLPFDQWHKVKRKSLIQFKGHEVPYPIEFSIREIFKFDPNLAIKITADFLSSVASEDAGNLEEWFKLKFGNTLAEEYFIPYNKKIWKNNPRNMDPQWVQDKLPIPNKYSFFEGLIASATDSMPHAEFYYPNSNNQNTFIDALAEGVNVKYNIDVAEINFVEDNKQWIINGEFCYDILINTTPIDLLPTKIIGTPQNIIAAAAKLKHNVISNVIWSNEPTSKTWTYIPEPKRLIHRYIHIGSFFSPIKGFTITEAIGDYSFDELKNDAKYDSFLGEPLDYNQSEHAYVVFDENYTESTNIVKEYLDNIGIYSIGRFGEWQYYNMDICIKSSMKLSDVIKAKYL